MYRKLRRVWSHNDMNHIPEFRKLFPELNHISSEEMRDRWASLGIDFYTKEKAPVGILTRLSLPFAVIFALGMFVSMPFAFMVTGRWGYQVSKKGRAFNWLASVFGE